MEVAGSSRAASTPHPAQQPAPPGVPQSLLGLRWAALALLTACLVVRLGPPDAALGDAPAGEFSAARAREHLEHIAREPHPTGSAAAREVEAYIAGVLGGLGLEVELSAGPACTEVAGLRRCAHVRNVVGTLPGRTRDGALLLSTHYDSVQNAPGAGDAGASVAALLEVARIASRQGPLEHDVILAFLDGEEELLLGSRQLCSAAELGSRVRLVANFDARGSSGAVTLISATAGSARAIAELASAVVHPVLSSFYPSVARALPNATDAEVYERCGLETLSFAFAAGFENYHQGTDTPARLDDRSLQHHGEYALAILRRFAEGAIPARDPSADGLVFFDVGALFVVRYPYALARLFAALLAGAAGIALRRRLRSGIVSLRALLLAAVVFVAACLAAVLIGVLVVDVVSIGWRPWASYLHAAGLGAVAACFVLGAAVPLAAWVRRRHAPDLLLLGPLLVWVALALATAAVLPGTSHVFTWPAAALIGALLLRERNGAGAVVARALALVPAVSMLTPVIYTLVVVLGAPGVAGAMACTVALFAAGDEPLALIGRRPRAAAVTLLTLGAVGGVGLALHVRGEAGPPTPNSVVYSLDAEARRAAWVSLDASVDAHERQFLGSSPRIGSVPVFGSDRPVLMNAAPALELQPPTLELISDRWVGAQRTLELRVRSLRGARSVMVWENTAVQFSSYRFDGAEPLPIVRFSPELDRRLLRLLTGLGDRQRWSITLSSPLAEGSHLTLGTRHAGALELQSADHSEGLAVLPEGHTPRSAGWTEGYPGDHTLVSGSRLVVGALPSPLATSPEPGD